MRLKREDRVGKRQFIRLLMVAGGLFAIIFLFSLSPTLSEWYMHRIYPAVAVVLSFISNIFPVITPFTSFL